jgi:hypothetical protein
MDSEIMNHPPYSPDFARADFRLFGPTEVQLGGQKIRTVVELKRGNLNWLRSWDKTFSAAGISNWPR